MAKKLIYIYLFKYRKSCNSDEECPSFSYCTEGPEDRYCKYESFICPEDENAYCHYVNSTIWDEKHEDVNYEDLKDIIFRRESKPIMKTCTEEQVDEKKCKTKKCLNNEDCFSGVCYSNTCITNQLMYMCESSYEENDLYLLNCRKRINMKCDSDEECISSDCDHGYCKKYKRRDYSLKDSIISLIIFFVVLSLPLYVILNTLIKFGIIRDPNERKKK